MAKTGAMRKLYDIIFMTLNNMVRLGVVRRHRGGKTQTWQIETANGEIVENAKHLEQYGITSHAPEGSETLIFNVQGSRTNNIVLNIGSRELRFKALNEGEVAIYDNSGNLIHLKNGGNMELIAPQSVIIKAQTAIVDAGSVELGGVGGKGVACLEDAVEVEVTSGSSAGTWTGKIISASSKVRAVK